MIDSLIGTFAADPRLQSIGLTPALVLQLSRLPPLHGQACLLRVIEVQREGLTLHDGQTEHAARAWPRLLQWLHEQGDALAVGDWVLAECSSLGEWWVHTRVPPLTQLARRVHDGRDKVTRQVIVSNVDTALLVMGLDLDFSPRRLERYLALTRLCGVAAVVVLTKADLCVDVPARLQGLRDVLPPDTPALALNALDPACRAALTPWLGGGRTLALLGSSGAGKSTLTNTLLGCDVQRTGVARRGDGRGRHTTTTRSLHRTPDGACIIDTPGLRTLRLDADAAGLTGSFTDVAALSPLCRFRDCRHEQEPGCAVREQVPAERLRSFRKLQREAQRDSLSALQRKEQLAQWKARSRATRRRLLIEGR